MEIYVNGIEGYETFSKNTARLVDDFRLILGQKPVAAKPDEGTEGGKRHYVTFMNDNRKVTRFLCEEGKPIPEEKIPAAPEGKKWDSIPELMPDKPVTVNAVPGEVEE